NNKWLYTNGANTGQIWNLSNFTKQAEIKDISDSDSSFIMNTAFLNDSVLIVNSGTSINKLNLFLYNFMTQEVIKVIKKDTWAAASGFMNNEFYYCDYSHLYIYNLKTGKEEVYEGTYSLASVAQYSIVNFTDELVFVPQ